MNYRSQSQFPPVVMNLIIINVLVFMATYMLDKTEYIIYNFALFPAESPFFKIWQPFTYMFLHGDIYHIFFNMFSLWMFGRTLEYELGWKRFLIYYLVCGFGAGLMQLGIAEIDLSHINSLQDYVDYLGIPTVGASGSVFGLLLAFGMLHPNAIIMLLIPPIPMKAKWFVMIYGLLELVLGVVGAPGVAHFAHLGGMFWGWVLLMWWSHRDRNRYIY
jgi:membrane associated rhomboid family serine protease